MRVLIACEYSGTVRDAFIAKGHEAMSCDLLPTEVPGPHYEGDVRDVLDDGWDLMIAHPTCTYLCNSGVSWLYTERLRWKDMIEGAVFFRALLNAPIPCRAIENPIMHGYAAAIIGSRQTQIVHPWMFGHAEQKATALWLRDLPPLVATNNVRSEMLELPARERERLHYLPPSPERWRERSRTYPGIAAAMADQWGSLTAGRVAKPQRSLGRDDLGLLALLTDEDAA